MTYYIHVQGYREVLCMRNVDVVTHYHEGMGYMHVTDFNCALKGRYIQVMALWACTSPPLWISNYVLTHNTKT